jgi:hypothetical protein
MSTLKQIMEKSGINLPETYIATGVGEDPLIEVQAKLLRECRTALDDLLKQKPALAGLVCGYTTLGNLRACLGAYRPQGVLDNTEVLQAKDAP